MKTMHAAEENENIVDREKYTKWVSAGIKTGEKKKEAILGTMLKTLPSLQGFILCTFASNKFVIFKDQLV